MWLVVVVVEEENNKNKEKEMQTQGGQCRIDVSSIQGRCGVGKIKMKKKYINCGGAGGMGK